MLPKLKLVWSGEVIVANDLVAMYKSKNISKESSRSTDSLQQTRDVVSVPSVPLRAVARQYRKAALNFGFDNNLGSSKILIRETKTIPRRVLVKVLYMIDVLKKVVSNSSQGKLLSTSEWELLQTESDKFNLEMNRLLFSWKHHDSSHIHDVEEESELSTFYNRDDKLRQYIDNSGCIRSVEESESEGTNVSERTGEFCQSCPNASISFSLKDENTSEKSRALSDSNV